MYPKKDLRSKETIKRGQRRDKRGQKMKKRK